MNRHKIETRIKKNSLRRNTRIIILVRRLKYNTKEMCLKTKMDPLRLLIEHNYYTFLINESRNTIDLQTKLFFHLEIVAFLVDYFLFFHLAKQLTNHLQAK